MDGILIIDKPVGLTSHDVVARVRRILGTRRVGHTGTLDPFATGVIVLLVGNATRLARFIDRDEKEYEALVKFGSETDTGDGTGREKTVGSRQTEERGGRDAQISAKLARLDWNEVFEKFRGEIMQTPPMYSAKKIDGKKLYELARKGIEVERQPVRVVIHELELSQPGIGDPECTLRIRVLCSAGTYIRTLAEDIGREIGIGAHLVELRRTRAGRFRLHDAATLKRLEKTDAPAVGLRPVSDAVLHLPAVSLSVDRSEKTLSGLATRVDNTGLADGATVRMLNPDSVLIAIGKYAAEEKSVKPKIVLV